MVIFFTNEIASDVTIVGVVGQWTASNVRLHVGVVLGGQVLVHTVLQ